MRFFSFFTKPGYEICPTCNGTGKITVTKYGSGRKDRPRKVKEDCPTCGGTGEIPLEIG